MTEDAPREFATSVVRQLQQAGFVAYWAGGCVRDLLLGRSPKDYDVATDARPDDVRRVFGRKRTHAVGAAFGVMLVRGPRSAGAIEVATFRAESDYVDGRRPQRVEFTTAEEDAQRRDFTINGMFYDPIAARVLDYVGGERDLGQGVVRAIGRPRDRVQEDKLRLLRAVRFTATLEFELDESTARAVREMAGELTIVSPERIAQELMRMLVDRHRRRAVELAAGLGLLTVVLPELQPLLDDPETGWPRTVHALMHLVDPRFELALATLLHAVPADDDQQRARIVRTICRRLRLSNEVTDRVVWLIRRQHALESAETLPKRLLKRLLAEPLAEDLLALMHAVLLADGRELHDVLYCREYLQTTPAEQIDPPPLLSGDDLIALGLEPGPQFRRLLDQVRDAQLDETIADRAAALDLVERLRSQSDDGI